MFLLSLNEIDRVKRLHGISSLMGLEEATGVTRKTWRAAEKTRIPNQAVLQALYNLGARADRILVAEDLEVSLAA